MKRQLKKRRGLPATEDVGIIANVLKNLRLECERKLGREVTAAVAARPKLPGITVEDLDDAMQYAGLRSLRAYNYLGDVSETSAAFAGMGYGLCSKPRDLDICEDEEAEMPLQYVLAVSLTHNSLIVTHTVLTDANASWELKTVFEYNLGLEALKNYRDVSIYWDKVRSTIRNVALISDEPLTTLLLLGEDGTNAKFLEVLRDALGDTQGTTSASLGVLSTTPDSLYVAAIGAAEFAKRFQ